MRLPQILTGKYLWILGALVLIVIAIRVFADGTGHVPTAQEWAAQDAVYRQSIKTKNEKPHGEWVDANEALIMDVQCMKDAGECLPCMKTGKCFTLGAPFAK
jgi:hypothetical protein